jgi:hypothetical protein
MTAWPGSNPHFAIATGPGGRPFSRPGQAARRRTSQTVAAMSSTDSASSQPPSIHWNGQTTRSGRPGSWRSWRARRRIRRVRRLVTSVGGCARPDGGSWSGVRCG